MKIYLIKLAILLIAFSCENINNNSVSLPENKVNNPESATQLHLPGISLIQVQSPLYLKDVNLGKGVKRHQTDSVKTSFIQSVVTDYYFMLGGDNSESLFHVKETYIQTLWLKLSDVSLYFVVVKDFPLQRPGILTLFFNEKSNTFINENFYFNLHTSFEYADSLLTETELHQIYCGSTPDVLKRDYNQNGITDFTFTRNYHNGTLNMVETYILEVTNNQIDTVFYELSKNLQLETEKTELKQL